MSEDFPSGKYDAWKTRLPEEAEVKVTCAGCGEPWEKAVRCSLQQAHCWDCLGTLWDEKEVAQEMGVERDMDVTPGGGGET